MNSYPGITAIRDTTGIAPIKTPTVKDPIPGPVIIRTRKRRKSSKPHGMAQIYKYSLYQDKELVLSGGSKKVAEFLCVDSTYISYAFRRGFLIQKKYRLDRVKI